VTGNTTPELPWKPYNFAAPFCTQFSFQASGPGEYRASLETETNVAGTQGSLEYMMNVDIRREERRYSIVLSAHLDDQLADTIVFYSGDDRQGLGNELLEETGANTLLFTGQLFWADAEAEILSFDGLTENADQMTVRMKFTYSGGGYHGGTGDRQLVFDGLRTAGRPVSSLAEKELVACPRFSNHPLLEKSSTLPAFLSVQSAMRGKLFAPVRIKLYGGEIDVWKETIGTCVQSNVDALRGLIAETGSDQQFIDAVANHLSNIANRKTAFSVTLQDQNFRLSQLQVESLFEVIEVLMLIDQ